MRYGISAMLVGVVALAGCAKSGTSAATDSSRTATASAAPAATAPSASDARHAIDSMNTKYADALTRADAATISAMYASDAIVDFPGAPVMSGTDAISKGITQDFAAETVKDPKIHSDDVITGGDLAVENGTWSWTSQPKKGGKAMDVKGHYLTVYKHQGDGTWKIVRDYVTVDPAGK
jgi:uncharacterized protein (TIGR02246 family)